MAKLILEMPDQTEQALQLLAQQRNLTVGELLQHAVGLYELALKRTAGPDGNKLSLTTPEGKVVANIDLTSEK